MKQSCKDNMLHVQALYLRLGISQSAAGKKVMCVPGLGQLHVPRRWEKGKLECISWEGQ